MNRDNSQEYKDWRAAVFKRDGFQCKMPNCKNKKRLQAHHILRWADTPALRYDVKNGITLCYFCHKKVFNDEVNYQRLFQQIVSGYTGLNIMRMMRKRLRDGE